MYKPLVFALAAVASALPAPQSSSALGAVPPKDKEFAVAFKVDGTFVSVNAVSNGTIGNLVLKAERLSVYPGTPAYFNGTGASRALNFDLPDGVYGAGVQKIGDDYGYAASAFAIFGYQQFEWSASNGTLYHTPAAALNSFFACEDEAEGEKNMFLKWGTPNGGTPPAGCSITEVVLNCNVEGGATDCNNV